MLTESEKQECLQILRLLSEDDIKALAATSTNYTVQVDSRSDAEKAILTFAESPRGLLSRRKIGKGILVTYCLNHSICVSVNASKAEYVEAIIDSWGCKTQLATPESQHSSTQNILNFNPSQIFNITVNIPPVTNAVTKSDSSEQTSAESFAMWFYDMLNACNPALNKPTDFGPHHFWDSAELCLFIMTPGGKQEEKVIGSHGIAERLSSFPQCDHIIYNPNISSQGVAVRSSNHGPKLILVCGTLHKMSDCIGIFQQSFGMVSDPLSPGRWKIQVTWLKMDQCLTSILPTLRDCGEIPAIEAHTTAALGQFTQGHV